MRRGPAPFRLQWDGEVNDGRAREAMMYEAFVEFLVRLSGNAVLWAVCVIATMAVTAVALYLFWDLVGRGVSLVRPGGRAQNAGRNRRSSQGH